MAKRRRQHSGFSMIEVMFALIIFTMMVLIYGAVFPLAVRTTHHSSNYTQAALLAQHKIDQLRAAGYGSLDYTGLLSREVIDPDPAGNAMIFTNRDQLVPTATSPGLFTPGSSGFIAIRDYNSVNASAPTGQVRLVTVTIQWTIAGKTPGSYSASALVTQASYP